MSRTLHFAPFCMICIEAAVQRMRAILPRSGALRWIENWIFNVSIKIQSISPEEKYDNRKNRSRRFLIESAPVFFSVCLAGV